MIGDDHTYPEAADGPAGFQIVCFQVGDQEYGLDIMRITEVINPVPVTPLPRAPSFIAGLVEVRGSFLPLIDLRERFGAPVTPPGRDTKLIIVGLGGYVVALTVDRVIEPCRVPHETIRDAPPLAVGVDARFLSGLAKLGDRVVFLVELDRLLGPDEQGSLRSLEDM